jgi:anti-sigma B factor antagonist
MGFTPQFTTRTESRNGVAKIALSGELDMATAPLLTESLGAWEKDGVSAIVLDLRDLAFVDSQGLRAFLQANNRARENGHRLILIGASRSARQLFELTGTKFLLDEKEAVRVLERFTRGRTPQAQRTEVPNVDAAF